MSSNAMHECGSDDFIVFLKCSTSAPYSSVKAVFTEISVNSDPGVLDESLSWRTEGRVSSLVHLALGVRSGKLDQLLFASEDLYSNAMSKTNAKGR